MGLSSPHCPNCRRELAAFVPRRRWVCVYCGVDVPFTPPVRDPGGPLPRRAPLGQEQDPPFQSWQQQRFSTRESLALLRLKLDRDRLLRAECAVGEAAAPRAERGGEPAPAE